MLPLDEHGYAFTALITIGVQLAFFAIAYSCGFDLVTDFAGSANFILLAALTLFLGPGGCARARPLVLSAFVALTRAQLAAFLLYRICHRSRDDRFNNLRGNCGYFFAFWVFQMMWVWIVTMPVIFVNSVPAAGQAQINFLDVFGWCVFLGAFALQVVADMQKYRFRANPDNRGKFCSTGLWRVSRHPNYFFEMMMWWGIWASACSVVVESDSVVAAWATLLSPLFTMGILLFLSGLPRAEAEHLARYYENEAEGHRWDQYRHCTSPLVPLPPSLYMRLPMPAKRVFLCEFPFLEFKPRPEDAES